MSIRLAILLILTIALAGPAYAQLSTVYVDATNGSDAFTGANASNSQAGAGPKATIDAGLNALANGGRLVIFAGIYAGDGVDSDGSPTIQTDNADINITLAKYPRLVSGLTIELRALSGNNEIRIFADANSVHAPNGALITSTVDQYIPNFIFNVPGGTLTITTTNGTEYLNLAQAHSSGSPVSGLFLTAGSVDFAQSSFFQLRSGASITIKDTSKFLHAAPQKGADLNLTYLGAGSFSAGAEAVYGSLGAGTLKISKDAGTLITFPSAMSFGGNGAGVQIISGNVFFGGTLSFGSVGAPGQAAQTADLLVQSAGTVTFDGAVTFVAANSATNAGISSVKNSGGAVIDFRADVRWNASYNSQTVSFPASDSTSVIWNGGNGSISFDRGIIFSHSTTTVNNGPATVEVTIQNFSSGNLTVAADIAVEPRTETSAGAPQQFSVAAVNNGAGVLEISGKLRSGLINSATTSSGGAINIRGTTVLGAPGAATGALVNSPNKVINLGVNTIILSGSVSHSLRAGFMTSTSGGIIVNASGPVSIDGGAIPNFTVSQPPGGSVTFTDAASFESFSMSSGSCLLQSFATVNGSLAISGGTLTVQGVQGRTLNTGSFRQTGGIFNLGGAAGGALLIRGDFSVTGGKFSSGTGSLIVLNGTSLQLFSPGGAMSVNGSGQGISDSLNTGQIPSLDIENFGGGVRLTQPLRVVWNLAIGSGCKLDLGSSSVALTGDAASFTNNGTFSATGPGVIIGGATPGSGGNAARNATIQGGTGSSFASMVIDPGVGNTCSVKGSAGVQWGGTLSLLSGYLDIASPIDFAPAAPGLTILRNVANFSGVTLSAGNFNAAGVHYIQRCVGDLASNVTMGPDLAAELSNADSLIIDVNSDTFDGDGNLATGQLRYFQFPAAGIVYGGTLVVGRLSAVQLAPNGQNGEALELSGSNVRHSIRGILKTAEVGDGILIIGANVTLTGRTQPGDIALIGNLGIGSTSLCTISNIMGITGSLTTFPGSSATLTMGALASQQRILGMVTLNGSNFTLGSNIEATSGVLFNSGTLNLGSFNLQLTTAGDFVESNAASGWGTSGGFLVMNRQGAQLRLGNTATNGVPNLQILSNTVLAAPGRVTKTLVLGSASATGIPSLVLGNAGNDLEFTGTIISLLSGGPGNHDAIVSNGLTDGTPGGHLTVSGPAVNIQMSGDFSIGDLYYNPPTNNGSLSFVSTDQTPHTLTIVNILTQGGGQIGLGANNLALTGTGSVAGNRAYNRSDGTLSASTGEVRFIGNGPQQFSAGNGFSLTNLRIWNGRGVTKAIGSGPLSVTRILDLSAGVFSFDASTLILENGAQVIRRRSGALLSAVPTFRGSVTVDYLVDPDNGNLTTSSELPSQLGILNNLQISNANPSTDSNSVLLDKNVVVSGTLFLDAGQLDLASNKISLATDATIEIGGGRFKTSASSSIGLSLSSYNLVYRSSAIVTSSSPEFQSGNGVSVSRLSVLGADKAFPVVLHLNSDRTVGAIRIDAPGGGIEFGPPGSVSPRFLVVRDSLTVLNGGFTNTTGMGATISLAGFARQAITVPESGLTLPGGSSAVHLQLGNNAGFTLTGGDLAFGPGALLNLGNGVLATGDNAIVLSHTPTSQGFSRLLTPGASSSHILGNVRQLVPAGAGDANLFPNGRFEFPVGSATGYRPLAISFTSASPAKSSSTVEVSYVDTSPGGVAGLPVDGQVGVRIGTYPGYFWRLNSFVGGFSSDQLFDLEVTVTNPGFLIPKVEDLRFIRRTDSDPTSSPWALQGSGPSYGGSNLIISPLKDTILTEKVISSSRGLSGANLFTIGIPIRPLIFARVLPDTTLKENQTLRFTYVINALYPGDKVSFSLINPPAGAVIDTTTGLFVWTPAFGQAGTYSIVVAATDGQYTIVTNSTLSVIHVNRIPVLNFRVPADVARIQYGTPTMFAISAYDPDGDPLTITWKVNGTVRQFSTDTTFTWTLVPTAVSQTVAAVFADPFGQSDSTVWVVPPPVSVGEQPGIPSGYDLGQNYPNPFNPSTTITVAAPERAAVQIAVYTLIGQCVRILFDGEMEAGYHQITWDGTDDHGIRLPSGVYMYMLKSSTYVQAKRMVLLK